MDRRRLNPGEQSQSQPQRFSWQLPLDDLPQRLQREASNNAHAQQRTPSNERRNGSHSENNFSHMDSQSDHRQQTYSNTMSHRPSAPGMSPIPQSPVTPIDPQRQSMLPPSSPQRPDNIYPAHYAQGQILPQQHQEYPPEKTTSFAEPQQTHPAQYAHYPDSVLQQTPTFQHPTSPQSTQPTQQSHNPPLSPGPLPLKTERDFQEQPRSPTTPRSPTMPPTRDPNYMPHSNTRIQSPKQPIFSPDSFAHPASPTQEQPSMQFHQPGQISHPNMNHSKPGASQEWKHSLCGFGDGSTCLEGIFCPCMVHSRTSYRLSQKRAKKDPTDLLAWSRFNGSCMIAALTCGLCGILPMVARTRIRHAYHLEGSVPGDFFRSCCCCCCAVIQNETEIKDREESSRRWAGPGTGEAYSTGEQMVYAPPPRG